MNQKYPMIAAAVAAALASGHVLAAPPTIAQAAAPTASLVIAGSSAAQSSVGNAIQVDICGGAANTLVVTSAGDKNFVAYSCTTAVTLPATSTSPAINAGTLITIYYRSEGGSVVGALPIVTGKQVKRLNLSDGSCTSSGTVGTCSVTGTTAANGPNDSWTLAVVNDTVQLGVTDVEPGLLTGADYPSNYSTTVFGSATPTQLAGLAKVRAIQQVFGLAVNPSGLTLAQAGVVNLTRESAANILTRKYTDWSAVPDAITGNPISSTPAAITRVDREPGSGTRTSANLYFLQYPCTFPVGITNVVGEQLNFSTGDELTQVNTTPGAIGYASIDNLLTPKSTAFTNVVMATINGVTPSTLAAATGQYDYWYEATLVPNSAAAVTSSTANTISAFLQTDVPKLAAAPLAKDINVIPNVGGNVATVPLTSRTGTATIYINPYTRAGNSCTVPSETNQ
jgi:hypothetical protein